MARDTRPPPPSFAPLLARVAVLVVATAGAPLAAQDAAAPSVDVGATAATVTELAATPAVVRIAVADIEHKGNDELAAVFLDSVLAEIRKLKRASVIGMDEVRRMLDLEAQKQIVGCGDEQSCLAEIAGAVGADVLIVAAIVDLGGERVVGMKRIDQRSASVSQQVSQRLTIEGGEEVLAMVGPGIEKLFPELPLREGEARGVSPELALRLNPPPLPVEALYTAGAIGGASLLAAVAAGAWWAVSSSSFRDLADTARVREVEGKELVGREGQMLLAEGALWATGGVFVAAAATTVAMVPFTNFAASE